MQILHTSDTHLGCAQFDYPDREQDVYDAFQEIVDTAIKERVDAVIHGGDIFHIPKPGGTPLVRLGEGIKALHDRGIRLYFTLGEHDISRITGTPSPYLFHKLGLATYVGDGKPVYHDDLLIVGYHKRRRGELEELIDQMKQADGVAKAHSGKRIVVVHQGLSEFHAWAGELTSNDLPPSFDYYAMGHLHDHFEKRFDRLGGPVCYPGSIDPTPGEGIKEFKKGFFIVDLSGEEAQPEWIEIQSSRMQYSYDVAYEALRQRVVEICTDIQSRDLLKKPMVSLRVKGGQIDNANVTSCLAKLLPLCLHYTWDVVPNEDEPEQGRLYAEKPADVREEMFVRAKEALHSEVLATFAVKELLPLLGAEQRKEALELVLSAFEGSRFEAVPREEERKNNP